MAKEKMKPAAIFLIIVAVLIVCGLGVGIWIGANPQKALQLAFVPSTPYAEDTRDPQPDYTLDANWAALPGKPSAATISPEGVMSTKMLPRADVFFVHPTTYLSRKHWNAPLSDADANSTRDNRMIKSQASVFNQAGLIYAPSYRQATFGAFLAGSEDSLKALSLAYSDVLAAFDNFINTRSKGRPFILAGHSQGALHLLYLIQHRITGTALSDRMIAAYIIGWPVSVESDLSALYDTPACYDAADTGCIVSYQTFGMGGTPYALNAYMNATKGLNGQPRKDTNMLCVNPLSWEVNGSAPKDMNKGSVPRPDQTMAPLSAPLEGMVGADCNGGVLYLSRPLDKSWLEVEMEGKNMHVYDYNLFYMNLRENAVNRTNAWFQNRAGS